jgi:gamma-glutamyl phosphate reductase
MNIKILQHPNLDFTTSTRNIYPTTLVTPAATSVDVACNMNATLLQHSEITNATLENLFNNIPKLSLQHEESDEKMEFISHFHATKEYDVLQHHKNAYYNCIIITTIVKHLSLHATSNSIG